LDQHVGARLAILVDGVLVALQPLVDRAEVEVDLRVAVRELERLLERRLRVLEPPQLEAHEPEVVVERVGLGALRDQLAVDLLGLAELGGAVVDEPEQVEDARVARAQQVGLFELPFGLVETARLEELLALVVVGEEQPLVERAAGDGLGHAQSRARTVA
jgi:hypothetical protein